MHLYHAHQSKYSVRFAYRSTLPLCCVFCQDSGVIVDLRTIGWLNYEDDELVLAHYREAEARCAKKRKYTPDSPEPSEFSSEWETSSPASPPVAPRRTREPTDGIVQQVPNIQTDRRASRPVASPIIANSESKLGYVS